MVHLPPGKERLLQRLERVHIRVLTCHIRVLTCHIRVVHLPPGKERLLQRLERVGARRVALGARLAHQPPPMEQAGGHGRTGRTRLELRLGHRAQRHCGGGDARARGNVTRCRDLRKAGQRSGVQSAPPLYCSGGATNRTKRAALWSSECECGPPSRPRSTEFECDLTRCRPHSAGSAVKFECGPAAPPARSASCAAYSRTSARASSAFFFASSSAFRTVGGTGSSTAGAPRPLRRAESVWEPRAVSEYTSYAAYAPLTVLPRAERRGRTPPTTLRDQREHAPTQGSAAGHAAPNAAVRSSGVDPGWCELDRDRGSHWLDRGWHWI
eukprot:388400-Prymnesium_polylepis.1